jgi:mannosyltransferase
MTKCDLRQIAVVAPNLHYRYSGGTASIVAVVPEQARTLAIASVGPYLPPHVPRIGVMQLITRGWSKPPGGRTHRIWHARRNDEMFIGLILRHVLRQKWKLVFTSAAQRKRTGLTRWLMRRMDGIVTPSEFSAAFIDVPTPVYVVHHGVDPKKFTPPADRAAAWAQAELPGQYGVGVFGRVRHQKGTDLFVEAMIRLLPKYPDWTAVITGLMAWEESGFIAALKKRIAETGMEARIHLLGERPQAEVPLWYQRITLYVAPMRNEGFGLTPLEAMASGAAVVATRTGAAPYLIAEGETGTIVPPENLDALIAAIEPMFADPSRAEVMGRAGREKAVSQHSLANEAANMNAAYEKVWQS